MTWYVCFYDGYYGEGSTIQQAMEMLESNYGDIVALSDISFYERGSKVEVELVVKQIVVEKKGKR